MESKRILDQLSCGAMVEINPRKEDFFRRVVEERKKFPKDDPMEYFLKIFASSGSYGLFVQVNQKEPEEPIAIGVFSGEHPHEVTVADEIEKAETGTVRYQVR